ncbi:MAG: prepilin-type N-terminal cleavage/methylation domain-containing protein [Sedimentisphaerales bacterium]|nr:prepilin-type N-terminal cleavage/methylation domain-containing protein [Sedimentisphaerales bacterium]
MASTSYKKKAFTLIELLVVVSIIALLISILLPALSRAREQAKAVACRSNIKQIGIGFFYYAEDYDGFSVPNCYTAPGTLQQYTWEHRLVEEGYLDDYALMECPSEKEYVNCVKPNAYFVGEQTGTRLDKNTPAELYLLADSQGNLTDHEAYDIPFYCPTNPSLEIWKYSDDIAYYQGFPDKFDNYFTPRHSGSFNILFADQHAEIQDREDVTENNLVPQ